MEPREGASGENVASPGVSIKHLDHDWPMVSRHVLTGQSHATEVVSCLVIIVCGDMATAEE